MFNENHENTKSGRIADNILQDKPAERLLNFNASFGKKKKKCLICCCKYIEYKKTCEGRKKCILILLEKRIRPKN